MHNPTLIPALLRDTSVNKGLIYRELRKHLPCRVGIEFEMGANFRLGFQKKYGIEGKDKNIAKFYNVLEIRNDSFNISLESALNGDDTIVESRISLRDFHQLSGLYKYMQDLPEFCAIHEGGGIHIHIDMSDFPIFDATNKKTNEVKNWLNNRLKEVQKMFPKYTGTFNLRKVELSSKQSWINMSNKNTLEFRILPLTFDYYTLMTWIVRIVKFRNKLIHECRLKSSEAIIKSLADEILVTIANTVPADCEITRVGINSSITSSRINADSGTVWYDRNDAYFAYDNPLCATNAATVGSYRQQ